MDLILLTDAFRFTFIYNFYGMDNPHSAVQNDIFLNNKDSQVLLLVLLLLIFLQNREKSRSSHFRSKVLISCLLPTMQKV